jgi:hypothetical protein
MTAQTRLSRILWCEGFAQQESSVWNEHCQYASADGAARHPSGDVWQYARARWA